MEEKKGQIAHLDQDRNNNKEDNLAFLCFDHHDAYDSKTSQSKGFAKSEVAIYRDNLYAAIESSLGLRPSLPENISAIAAHDIEIFQKAEIIMNEIQLDNLIYSLGHSDSFKNDDLEPITLFRSFFRYSSNYFIDSEITETIIHLLQSLRNLTVFLGTHFFMENHSKILDNPIYGLYPELKYDNPSFYEEKADELSEILREVDSAYKNFRISIKRKLFI